MSTPAQVAERAAKNRRRLLVGGIVMSIISAVFVGWIVGQGFSSGPASPEQEPSAPPSEPLADPDSFVPESGRELVLGQYPAGFPRSYEGAASAAVHAVRSMTTNDAGALADIATIYYGFDVTIDMVEDDLLKQRAREIEITKPTGAPFNPDLFPAPGSYYSLTPIGVAWNEVEDGVVEVWILSEDEVGDGMGLAFTRTHIHGRQMRWDEDVRGGDWVIDLVTDPVFADFYEFDPDEYSLDNPLWTPIAFPEWDESE